MAQAYYLVSVTQSQMENANSLEKQLKTSHVSDDHVTFKSTLVMLKSRLQNVYSEHRQYLLSMNTHVIYNELNKQVEEVLKKISPL